MLNSTGIRKMMLMLSYSYLYSLKLITGEHLLVMFLTGDDKKVTFKYPMLMKPISVPTEFGLTELEMGMPWMISTESRVHTLDRSNIILLTPMGTKAADLYMSLLEKYEFLFLENEKDEKLLENKVELPPPIASTENVNDFLQKIEEQLDQDDIDDLDDESAK
jgi:hypothetical protein